MSDLQIEDKSNECFLMEHLLPRFANFRVAADCLIQSSTDLFGASHAATVALAEALDAVGIRDAQTCHDAGDCR